MKLFTDATQRMIITNTGNVGIGTITPGAKLDVVGDITDVRAKLFSANRQVLKG